MASREQKPDFHSQGAVKRSAQGVRAHHAPLYSIQFVQTDSTFRSCERAISCVSRPKSFTARPPQRQSGTFRIRHTPSPSSLDWKKGKHLIR
eukprot:7258870-Pyramimonas_sp.AAC.1